MPLIGWDAFCESHHRPFMIHGRQVAEPPQVRFGALQRFISSIGLIGNFALFQGDNFVRAVFELEADAVRVARALGARAVGQGDEWAGQWLLSPDWETAERITAHTSSLRRSPSRRKRSKQHVRRRWHQFPMAQWTISA